jgi:Cu(I)-responsive transcriptional regulator
MQGLSIGEAAKAAGTGAETIRYYEKIGLLPKPARTSGNYRSYGVLEVARLTFIRRARELGFSLDHVRTLLSLSDDRGKSCGEVDEIARAHLETVEQKIADLTALKRELSNTISQCSQGTIADCRILEALAPRPNNDSKTGA